MITKAMEWIKNHGAPTVTSIDGAQWSDRELKKFENVKRLEPVGFCTLTSLTEYLESRVDVPNDFVQHIFINVASPDNIIVYSEANANNYYRRTEIAKVRAMLPVVKIGQWVDQTEFCIMMRANFIDNGLSWTEDGINGPDTDRDALISVASNIVSGTIAQYEDTGISQKATLRTGIQESDDRLLPERVILRPYRTFMEVEQTKSEFIFRARDDKYDGVQLSLHEADGGRWRLDAMSSVKNYLMERFADVDYITITA